MSRSDAKRGDRGDEQHNHGDIGQLQARPDAYVRAEEGIVHCQKFAVLPLVTLRRPGVLRIGGYIVSPGRSRLIVRHVA
jgi:hypothetical protein